MSLLTAEERQRYNRQMMMKEVGEDGQEKLKRSKVFIAGSGGLGSPIAIYLAVAGVGTIRIVDHDRVDVTNLNRQVLHWDRDIDRKKVDSAMEKLRDLNSALSIEALGTTITEENVSQLVADFDVIVDAMDNLPTRYILNGAAIDKDIPFFHGAVHGFEGRAMTVIPKKTACLRCISRGPIPQEKFPVMGVTPGVIGIIQATEVIKYILRVGKLLTNRLLMYDGLRMIFTEFKVKKNPNCEHCGQLT